MDLLEVEISPYLVIAFDGRVLEIFQGSGSVRHHVKLIAVAISPPDKKGLLHVTFKRPWSAGAIGNPFTFDQAELERLRPLLDRLVAAGVPVAG